MEKRETTSTILVTGTTGLIGRHVLFELLRNSLEGRLDARIALLVRPRCGVGPRERIVSLLNPPSLPEYLAGVNIDDVLSRITVIEGDLRTESLCDKFERSIPKSGKLHVVAAAASTNLLPTERARRDVYENNFLGTLNLLRALSGYRKKVTFLSTAFSTGNRAGLIPNELLDGPEYPFRTPYEEYKRITEMFLRKEIEGNKGELQILRPSVVCGRLLDAPLHFTSKFDVFYGWGKIFYRKLKADEQKLVRIWVNRESGLNIVAADYVAKAIIRAMETDIPELNIAHSQCVSHTAYLSAILGEIGFDRYEFLDREPVDRSRLEEMYYATVGKAFSPYITSPPHEFDVRLLRSLLSDVDEPDILAGMQGLIRFAIDRDFDCSENREPVEYASG
jgi:nucleoside-diphosphate-sugar epimerase